LPDNVASQDGRESFPSADAIQQPTRTPFKNQELLKKLTATIGSACSEDWQMQRLKKVELEQRQKEIELKEKKGN
jgi:hypothetical protein